MNNYEMEGGAPGRWERYLPIVLKKMNPDGAMGSSAKKAVSDLLCHLGEKMMLSVNMLVESAGRKTISVADLMTVCNVMMPGELAKHSNSEGNRAVNKYTNFKSDGVRPHSAVERAGLVLPPSRAESEMRKYTRFNIGKEATVFLAAVLEYMAAEILELSDNMAREHKVQRITVRHLTLAIKYDEELTELFHDITFVHGGVVPHIDPRLMGGALRNQQGGAEDEIPNPAIQRLGYKAGVKHLSGLSYEEIRAVMREYLQGLLSDAVRVAKRYNKVTISSKIVDVALKMDTVSFEAMVGGKRRTKSGKLALRKMKAIQKSGNLVFAKATFQRIVRNIIADLRKDTRVSAEAFEDIQGLTENHLINILRSANLIALQAGRTSVKPMDISIARRIMA